MERIRVLVGDDDRWLASAVADSLRSAPDIEVVGVCQDADAVIEAAAEHQPDVVLMDVRMPGSGGVAAARRVLAQQSCVAVVGLSAYEDVATVTEMLEAGAAGFIVKGMPEDEILEAVRRAKRGQMSIPAALGHAAIHEAVAKSRGGEAPGAPLYHPLLDALPDAIVAADSTGRIKVVNSHTEDLFGYTRDELLAMSVDDLIPESMRVAHATHRERYQHRPWTRPMGHGLELFGRRRDGTDFPVDISLSPMPTETGILVIATVRDISERKAAERRRARTHQLDERRTLVATLVQAQEEERRKIAADIHDDSIQAMTAVSLRLQQLRKNVTTEQQQQLIARLDEAVRESITRLRRLMFDLRPPTLDRTGLGPALRELLERLRADTEIEYKLDDRLTSEPTNDVRIELYRIAQEALANVRKHSSAKHVEVALQRVDSGFHVSVADDGVGFDVATGSAQPGHLGLVAMRERATIGGGWWTVESTPGHGAVVDFWLPDERDPVRDEVRREASG